MALPASGAISLSDFNTELGITAGTQISMNDADVRALLGLSSGAEASFSDYYGASSSVDIALTIASNTNNYNIFSSKGGSYVAGKTNVTLTVNSGVSVGSTSTGTYALETGTGWASGDTITVINNGTVKGRGGNGGVGGSRAGAGFGQAPFVTTPSAAGSTGGNAFRAQFATAFTNNGSVYGGGGGGGGGGSATTLIIGYKGAAGWVGGSGGGGGAGVTGSSGGAGGTADFLDANNNPVAGVTGASGGSGTSTSGGGGGASQTMGDASGGQGGNGGGLGSDGGAGADGVSTAGTAPSNFVESGKAGGTRGYYQVGASFINSGSGISGTRAGRSG